MTMNTADSTMSVDNGKRRRPASASPARPNQMNASTPRHPRDAPYALCQTSVLATDRMATAAAM